MNKVNAYVGLVGDDENEAKNYLEYNAPSIKVRLLGISDDNYYLFEVLLIDYEFETIKTLKDVKVFSKIN